MIELRFNSSGAIKANVCLSRKRIHTQIHYTIDLMKAELFALINWSKSPKQSISSLGTVTEIANELL